MRSIGSYEAKTKLSELIEMASAGESILITKHGRSVARLGPISGPDEEARAAAFETLASLRASCELGVELGEARAEGRM